MNRHGRALGVVNVFFADGELAVGAHLVAQAFADIASLVIVQTGAVPTAVIAARTRAALEERTVIERAKGVIAYAENLPMDAAFDRLIALARDQARSLTVLAATVVDKAAATGPRLKS
jgi:hypothetical protein